ncbi:Zinc finger protein 577, partial [Fragariocoptes setiger]
ELGDHDEKFHQLNYVSQFKLVANQTPELERAAAIAHQSDDLRGLSSSEAEHHFLKRVIRLDSYGIDPFSVTDYSCSNDHYKIGVNHTGIITFQDNKKIQHFLWEEVRKISLDGRTIILHTFRPNKDKKKSTALFGFKCESSISCHNLWKLATEHRYFFTIESSDQVPAVTNAGGLFNRSCKLRYTGKVERELLRDPSNRIAERVPIKRTRSLILRGVNERSEWGGGKLASLEESGYDEEGECHGVNRTLPSSMNYAEENSSSDERRTLPTEFNLKPNISPIHENRNSNQFVNNQPKRRNLTKTKDQQRKILVAKRNPSLKGSTLKSLMSDAIVYTVGLLSLLAFNMDLPLSAFKTKIKEAVVLVPDMTGDHKMQAVQYWNCVSVELQGIVNKSAPQFAESSKSINDNSINVASPRSPSQVPSIPSEQMATNMPDFIGNTNDTIATGSSNFVANYYDMIPTNDQMNCNETLRGASDINTTSSILDQATDQITKQEGAHGSNEVSGSSILIPRQPCIATKNTPLQSPAINEDENNDIPMFASPESYELINHMTKNNVSFPNTGSDCTSPSGIISNNSLGLTSTTVVPLNMMGTTSARLNPVTSEYGCIQSSCSRKPDDGTSMVNLSMQSMTSELCLPSASDLQNQYVNNQRVSVTMSSKSMPMTSSDMTNTNAAESLYGGEPTGVICLGPINSSQQQQVAVPPHSHINSSDIQIGPDQLCLPLQPNDLNAPRCSALVPVSSNNQLIQSSSSANPHLDFNQGQAELLDCDDSMEATQHRVMHSPQILNCNVNNGYFTSNDNTICTTSQCFELNSTDDLNSKTMNYDSNQQHVCHICGKSGFSTKGNLKRHLRAHSGEKPFKCDCCESRFTEKKSLKIHIRTHTGEKPYKCNICGKLFSQTGVLQSHMALHLNERKFVCHMCGKAFRQRSQLKLHIMRHEGIKRLECPTCPAKFLTKGDMERHNRIHTGERPYLCSICKKSFTRQQSLNEHLNRHYGNKPYKCDSCDKRFSEMSACYKHAKIHKKQSAYISS